MFKKLKTILENYDIIMEMVDEQKKHKVKFTQVEPKDKKGKTYSIFNVPREQQDYIIKKMSTKKKYLLKVIILGDAG